MMEFTTTNLNNYKAQQSKGDWLQADEFTSNHILRFTKDEVDKVVPLYEKLCSLKGVEPYTKGNTLYSFFDAMLKMFLIDHIEGNAELLIEIAKGDINF